MSVNIVTGFTGRAHITSDDDRIRNAAYIGTDKFVMPFGNQFEAEVQNNNLVRIKDGMLMNQGTQMGIELTDYEDVVIENGLSGTNRNDLIVMRYEKQDDTGLESASLVVIKGTSGATASDPTYISGNIIDGGDLIDDYPLYRVKIESLSIVAVQQLFSTRADVGSELNRIENAFNSKMDKNNPTGTGSFSMNRKENTTVGSKSVAVNRNTTASGDSSFASGFNNTASGLYSNASGTSTTASGSYSHTEGGGTTASNTASHAEGSSTTASGSYSHAEGENTTASGISSHAEGMNTTASGERSHAAGYWTTAGYSNQTVVGKHNDNKETNLFEVGNGTSSSNRSNALEVRQNGDVHAGGDFYDGNGNKVGGDITSKMNKTNPTGTGSFSMNRKANTTVGGLSATVNENNTASGDGSFASGRNNTASGLYSNASGTSTTASGSCSHAEGMNTTASGSCSHAEGENTTASGISSHAEGMNTTASGERSHAAGYWTTAGYSNQTVVGKHNDNKETNLFEVGNGISGSSKSNAFEVSESGNAIAGADLLYDGHKRITGSYASDILVECTDLRLGPDNTITGRDGDNVPIHTGTYDLKVGSIIYVPEDLHFGMNIPAGLYEVLYLVDGGNDISYLSFGDYQRDEPDPEHVKYMPKSLEERIETALSTTKTATGNPISVSDSAHVNAEGLTVELEPIQDLHGYDKPWVGGAGKNLLPMTVDGIKAINNAGTWSGNSYTTLGITFTLLTDNDGNIIGINANGTCDANYNAQLYLTTPNYIENIYKGKILNGCVGGDYSTFFIYAAYSNNGTSWASEARQISTDYTISSSYDYITLSVLISKGNTVSNVKFYPMIRLATETDSTFEPYENKCPITGYTNTSLKDNKKNLLPLIAEPITVAGISYTYETDEDGNRTGIICNGTSTGVSDFWFVDGNNWEGIPKNVYTISLEKENDPDNVARLIICADFVSVYTSLTIDTYIGGAYIAIPEGVTVSNLIIRPMVRLATDTDPTFEPYTANTYTLQFGDTVYGAEVDFVNGVATVAKGYIAEYAGETLPSTWISDRDVYASGTTPTTGAQVVYELATPYTIQLTPQQIKMLKGNNVLTADGEVELTYQTDSVVGDVKEWAEEKFIPKSYGPVGAPFSIIFTETDSGGYTSVFTCNKTHSEIVDYIFENGLSNVTAEIRGYNGYRQIAVNCGSSKSDDVYFAYTQYVSSSSLVFSSLRMTSTDTIVFNQARAQIQS